MNITTTRIGPGHYEVFGNGESIGFLFDDHRAANRNCPKLDRWRFSSSVIGEHGFVGNTKRDVLYSLRNG